MKKGAMILKTDGSVQKVQPANGSDFTLEELQGFVEGLIEIIDIGSDMIMVVNEEGKGVLEPNSMATVIAKARSAILPHDYIAGNALMCPSDMVQ
jgi:hypothetical protein